MLRRGAYPNIAAMGSTWTPASIAGALAWWDGTNASSLWQGSDRTTAVTTNGDAIGWADDLDTDGNEDVIQATTSAKPTYNTAVQNGQSAMTFDGGDHLAKANCNLDLSAGFTVWFAGKITNDSASRGLLNIADDGAQNRMFFVVPAATSSVYVRAQQSDTVFVGRTAPITTNVPVLLVATYNGGTASSGVKIYKNGTQIDNANSQAGTFTGIPSTTTASLTLGAYTPSFSKLLGSCYMAGLYNNAISDADRGSLESYVNARLAIW